MEQIVRATTPPTSTGAEQARFMLPPKLLERASNRLCWISMLVAVTVVLSFMVQRSLQPEVAAAQKDLVLPLVDLFIVFFAGGLIALQRFRLVPAQTILLLGMVFQIYVAFGIAFFETSLQFNPAEPVRGTSIVAVWICVFGFLIPNVPLATFVSAFFSASMWPLAYWINITRLGYPPLPWNRLTSWLYLNYLAAAITYFIAKRIYNLDVIAQRAQDLGSYQLDYLIGKGGMGEVWKAQHKMLVRDAAIKIIRPELMSGVSARQADTAIRRFEREARVTANLQSPHTVYLYDFGTAKDGHFYYVMELLDGISLQFLVDKFGPQPASRVIAIVKQICESLEEAHRYGLVHRDLKPSNVMLCKFALHYDFAKILDFGLVKPTGGHDETNLTMEGVSAGTPGYMAPEIAMGEHSIDGRVDLYSLGCLAYLLLTGHMVFEEASATAMAIAHVQKEPVPPSLRTEVPIPASLEAVVLKCLAKKREDRPSSALELSRMLDDCHDVPVWCDDQAALWWDKHLPEGSSYRHSHGNNPAATFAAR